MEYSNDDAESDEEAYEIFPVLTGKEGEQSSNKVVKQAGDKNGNEHRHEVEKVLYGAFFQTGKHADQQNKKDKKTYQPFHIENNLKLFDTV